MEEFGGNHFIVMSGPVRRRRTHLFRRPQPDSCSYDENEPSHSSPAPPSDDASKGSSDETISGETNFKRKEFNLNQCVHVSSSAGTETEESLKNLREDDGGFSAYYRNNEHGHGGIINKRSSEGVLGPANWKSTNWQNGDCQTHGQSVVALDESGNESRVKKVKLKVGGVTHTISTSNGASEAGAISRVQQNAQGTLGHTNSPSDKRGGLQGIPWKDFSRGGFIFGKEDFVMRKMAGKSVTGKQGEKSVPVRKGKRMSKKRALNGELDNDEDDEIRYLEKLKASRISIGNKEFDEDSGRKQRKLASVSDIEQQGACRAGKGAKRKPRADRVFKDADYVEEDETGPDGDLEQKKKKKQKKELIDCLMDNNKREVTLTTRQRALQSSKDTSIGPGSSLIEFPNGLPSVPPRKQKEKLSEVVQQLKKAEAAQRRKIQNEKAARESEAEAIRKILGQDSNRKKREEKMKKRQEALAEEKAANASMLSSNTIRWVMGPSGTVVIFPNEMGLPNIFDSKPCSYPPPRENCAGPSCPNPYKYRDSKTKLPLCSLQCYKAVQQKVQSEAIC